MYQYKVHILLINGPYIKHHNTHIIVNNKLYLTALPGPIMVCNKPSEASSCYDGHKRNHYVGMYDLSQDVETGCPKIGNFEIFSYILEK